MARDEPQAGGDRALSRAPRGGRASAPSVCHATYLINLGATDDVIYHKSVKALVGTMETAHAFGSEGVIFHVGSHLGRGFEAAMHQVIPGLQVVLGERDRQELEPWLLIENAAGHAGDDGRLPGGAGDR